jgi:hypothetical protein
MSRWSAKNRRWVQEQAESFVRQVARYGFARPLPALLERADEPGPTDSGPIRNDQKIACTMVWDGTEACSKPGRLVR